ncbi:hypothetical protein THIOSC13_1450003 [uncultured Thiomicrorhabdus sp.]
MYQGKTYYRPDRNDNDPTKNWLLSPPELIESYPFKFGETTVNNLEVFSGDSNRTLRISHGGGLSQVTWPKISWTIETLDAQQSQMSAAYRTNKPEGYNASSYSYNLNLLVDKVFITENLLMVTVYEWEEDPLYEDTVWRHPTTILLDKDFNMIENPLHQKQVLDTYFFNPIKT